MGKKLLIHFVAFRWDDLTGQYLYIHITCTDMREVSVVSCYSWQKANKTQCIFQNIKLFFLKMSLKMSHLNPVNSTRSIQTVISDSVFWYLYTPTHLESTPPSASGLTHSSQRSYCGFSHRTCSASPPGLELADENRKKTWHTSNWCLD